MSVLSATICGYLGQDATSNIVGGETVVNLNIAHSEKWKDQQGNQKEKTTWVQGNWWTSRTGILPYLKKGTLIYATGTPEARNYTSKTGEVVAQLSLRVINVHLLGGQKNDSGNQPNAAGHTTQQVASDISVPDPTLPF